MKKTPRDAGFTLFEVIMALMILGLLSGAVYSITSAALQSSQATITEQAGCRRVEAFARVLRDAFLNLPRDARVFLKMGKSSSGAPVQEMIFAETSGTFGVASVAGGSLILSDRPKSDGTRTFSILRVPAKMQGNDYDRMMAEGPWIPILPGVEKIAWSFFRQGKWQETWADGAGRPEAVRLSFDYRDLPGTTLDFQFWVPPLAQPPAPSNQQTAPNPNPAPSPNANK